MYMCVCVCVCIKFEHLPANNDDNLFLCNLFSIVFLHWPGPLVWDCTAEVVVDIFVLYLILKGMLLMFSYLGGSLLWHLRYICI